MKRILILSSILIIFLAGCSCQKSSTNVNYAAIAEPKKDEIKTNEQVLGILARLNQEKIAQADIDQLLKSENGDIYYLASNNKRYLFPTDTTFKSWFGDYDVSKIKILTLEQLYETGLGGNVYIKPYSLIKTETDFNTYFVDKDGLIRIIPNNLLAGIYGDKWQEKVIDIPNNIFTNYNLGPGINSYSDFPILKNLTIENNQINVK